MTGNIDLWEIPFTKNNILFIGWRQWADAGSVSSGLPRYLIDQEKARQIGKLSDSGYYIFQLPGTHDLFRPIIRYEDGHPTALETQLNEIYFHGNENTGITYFIGDEPHINVEHYCQSILDIAKQLNIHRIIGFGGVYGEVPFTKERLISSTYSLPRLKVEVEGLNVNLSDYQGGASIGSYLCRRAGESDFEYISFYAFIPSYNFNFLGEAGKSIRIENDFYAWLGILKRVNHLYKLSLDLSDLEIRSAQLKDAFEAKIDEIDRENPELGVKSYLKNLAENFEEISFNPTDNFWEEKLRGLFDRINDDDLPVEPPSHQP